MQGTERVYEIEKIIVHERNGQNDAGYDIALLKLARDVQYTAAVRPICLPKNPLPDSANSVAIGWGDTKGRPQKLIILMIKANRIVFIL